MGYSPKRNLDSGIQPKLSSGVSIILLTKRIFRICSHQ